MLNLFPYLVNCKGGGCLAVSPADWNGPALLCSQPDRWKHCHQNPNRAFILLVIQCSLWNCPSISSLWLWLHEYVYFVISKGKMLLVNVSCHLLCHSTISTWKENVSWLKWRWIVWVYFDSVLEIMFMYLILLVKYRSIFPYLQWENSQNSNEVFISLHSQVNPSSQS